MTGNEMINPLHFRTHVIRPTIDAMGMGGENAESLLLYTAAQESGLGSVGMVQLGGGPALGVYQIEPATHLDVWDNWLVYREVSAGIVRSMARQKWGSTNRDSELVGNLFYATAIARLIYRRAPEALPADIAGMAHLWKLRYNTAAGKGHEEEFISAAKLVRKRERKLAA